MKLAARSCKIISYKDYIKHDLNVLSLFDFDQDGRVAYEKEYFLSYRQLRKSFLSIASKTVAVKNSYDHLLGFLTCVSTDIRKHSRFLNEIVGFKATL